MHFCFGLHPDILTTSIGPFTHINNRMNWLQFRNYMIESYIEPEKQYSSRVDKESQIPGLEEYYYESMIKIKNEFECIEFKGDFAEFHSNVLERLDFPVLFIYLFRNFSDRFLSENNWFHPNMNPAEFIQLTKQSLAGVDKIKTLSNVDFRLQTVFSSHDETREWFSSIMAEIGLPLSEWQKKYLEKRRRIAISCPRLVEIGPNETQITLDRLYAAPDYEAVSKEYGELYQSSRI